MRFEMKALLWLIKQKKMSFYLIVPVRALGSIKLFIIIPVQLGFSAVFTVMIHFHTILMTLQNKKQHEPHK